MNRKPGVKVLFNISFLIEQFGYEKSFEVLCMLEPACLSYVSIGYTKKPFDLRQGRAMARRKSGEALLTQWQVASCQLSPWLAFLELILKLTGPHSSR